MFMVNINMPEGTAISATDSVVRYVEKHLKPHPRVKYYTSNTGRGNPRIYYNEIPRNAAANYGQIFVQLLPEVEPREKEQIIDGLRETFKVYPNAKIEVKNFEQGPPIDAPVAIRIFGENLDTLRQLAGEVEQLMEETPGAIYVNNPLSTLRTDLKVRIHKEKAGMLGIPTAEIDRAVRLAVAGLKVGTFSNSDGDEFDMVVGVEKGAYPDLGVLDRSFVQRVAGMAVPLRQVADIELQSSPPMIKHYDKSRFITISSFVKSGYLAGEVNAEVVKKLDALRLPAGYRFGIAGEAESRADSFGGLGTIIVITIFGFLGVLVLEFGTFKSTLIVLSVIPLGAIGAILILWATGYTFSFVAIVGLIALAGIEVKNSILLVDFTNQLRRDGMPLEQAIRQAGEVRFVPIVLTSLTAIGGLLPLALEFNPLYSPLAWVLIGGLISSTLLSRVVTPVMYKLLPPRI
jgi:multidrug efflux pump subunit AcrB